MKTILITGASSGIGKATAKHFAAQGRQVIATMRSPEKETKLNQLENVLVVPLDVTNWDSIQAGVKAGTERFGHIDVLVNNAGYGLMGPVEALKDTQTQKQWEVNVYGVINMMKAVLPAMRERKSGTIINISSIGGSISFPGMAMYMATKWAVDGLSENMVYELDQIGVTMKIVKPGAIKTDFAHRSMDMPETMPDEYLPMMGKLQEMFGEMLEHQASDPSLVAEVIYQAATDGTDQLRYLAGPDAEQMYAMRQSQGDMAWIAYAKQMFGL